MLAKKGIFVGLSTIDIVYRVNELPKSDSKLQAQSQSVCLGGPATNAALTFAALGGQATLITVIGSHPMNQIIGDELKQQSVSVIDLNPDFSGIPTLSSVLVVPDGHRAVVSANAERLIALRITVSPSRFDGVSVVLVDGHFMESCITIAREARARGIPVVMDGGSWKPGTENLLRLIDVAICSSDFLPPTCQREDDVIKFLKSHGIKQIAITKGDKPIRYVLNESIAEIPVPTVFVVDTLGAGDVFHGAFCAFLT